MIEQAKVISGMRKVNFTDDDRRRHVRAFNDAHLHMVQADRVRVMNFTNLRNPFAPRRNMNTA